MLSRRILFSLFLNLCRIWQRQVVRIEKFGSCNTYQSFLKTCYLKCSYQWLIFKKDNLAIFSLLSYYYYMLYDVIVVTLHTVPLINYVRCYAAYNMIGKWASSDHTATLISQEADSLTGCGITPVSGTSVKDKQNRID